MGKLTKAKKRSKTKTKKVNSKSKPKTSKKPTSVSGAPENMIIKNEEVMHNEEESIDSTASPIRTFRLNRRIMKVRHSQIEEKAIRKAQRALNRATNNGDQQEIEEAEELLDEAIMDKKEVAQWSHPEETIGKLKEILEYQIQNEQEPEIIEQTQEFLEEA